MVLVDTKSFLFGHGTLKISLQTDIHLNGWLSVVSLDAEEERLLPHPKGDDFTQPKPITHQAAWALLHERSDMCEKHIWNQITSE